MEVKDFRKILEIIICTKKDKYSYIHTSSILLLLLRNENQTRRHRTNQWKENNRTVHLTLLYSPHQERMIKIPCLYSAQHYSMWQKDNPLCSEIIFCNQVNFIENILGITEDTSFTFLAHIILHCQSVIWNTQGSEMLPREIQSKIRLWNSFSLDARDWDKDVVFTVSRPSFGWKDSQSTSSCGAVFAMFSKQMA